MPRPKRIYGHEVDKYSEKRIYTIMRAAKNY